MTSNYVLALNAVLDCEKVPAASGGGSSPSSGGLSPPSPASGTHASPVLPWLFLGGKPACELAFREENPQRITAVLNLCEPWCPMGGEHFFRENDKNYEGFEAIDDPSYPLLVNSSEPDNTVTVSTCYRDHCRPILDRVRWAWERWKRRGGEKKSLGAGQEPRILVHCAMGINRSCAVVVAYLLDCHRGLPLLTAAALVREKRRLGTGLIGNKGFRHQIVQFAEGIAQSVLDPGATPEEGAPGGFSAPNHSIGPAVLDPPEVLEFWLDRYHAEIAPTERSSQREEEEFRRSNRRGPDQAPPEDWWGRQPQTEAWDLIGEPVRVRLCGEEWCQGTIVAVEESGTHDGQVMAGVRFYREGEAAPPGQDPGPSKDVADDWFFLGGRDICITPKECR